MANNKFIHLGNLRSFWRKAEAWITANFQALFDQGEQFESDINDLEERVSSLEDDWVDIED